MSAQIDDSFPVVFPKIRNTFVCARVGKNFFPDVCISRVSAGGGGGSRIYLSTAIVDGHCGIATEDGFGFDGFTEHVHPVLACPREGNEETP